MEEAYCVVEFAKGKLVETVPRCWVQFLDVADYCFFPRNNARNLIEKAENPDTFRWPRYLIKVLAKKVTYLYGLELTRRLGTKGTMASSSDEGNKKRKAVEPDRFSPFEGYESDYQSQQPKKKTTKETQLTKPFKPHAKLTMPTPPKYVKGLPGNSKKKESTENNKYVTITTSKVTEKDRPVDVANNKKKTTQNLMQTNDQNDEEDNMPLNTDYYDDETVIGENLEDQRNDGLTKKLLIQMAELLDNQKSMMGMIRRLTLETPSADEFVRDLIDKPCETVDQLIALNDTASEDEHRRKFIRYLATFGRGTVSTTVTSMMSYLGTRGLWSDFNVEGRGDKLAFNKLMLYKMVIRAAGDVHRGMKEVEVIHAIGDFLKHSPERHRAEEMKKNMPDPVCPQLSQEV